MKADEIAVCGNYGYRTGQLDGQTVKTRELAEYLGARLNGRVRELDSSTVLHSPVRFMLEALRKTRGVSQMVVMPGRRGLQILVPLLYARARNQDASVRYVVVGGWLPEVLQRKGWLRRICNRLDGMYVETENMAARLRAQGVGNVSVAPNFRVFDRTQMREPRCSTTPLRLVFCSRVQEDKGVEDGITAVQMINSQSGRPLVSCDVYGPLNPRYRAKFEQCLRQANSVTYRGVISPENIHRALAQYDVLIFPTYYEGEGFPGIVVDAFISGLPVIASDWKYNSEVVRDGYNGMICRPQSPESLVSKIYAFAKDPGLINLMRLNCLSEAVKYHPDNALGGLLRDIGVVSKSS